MHHDDYVYARRVFASVRLCTATALYITGVRATRFAAESRTRAAGSRPSPTLLAQRNSQSYVTEGRVLRKLFETVLRRGTALHLSEGPRLPFSMNPLVEDQRV